MTLDGTYRRPASKGYSWDLSISGRNCSDFDPCNQVIAVQETEEGILDFHINQVAKTVLDFLFCVGAN